MLRWGIALSLLLWQSGGIALGQDKATCECSVAAGMEKLPKMTYRVGEDECCCQGSAEKMAKDSGKPVHFVVEEKEYETESKAMEALADATEKFVNAFVEPSTCKVSGTTAIAGQEVNCQVKAGSMAKAMAEAMKTVSMTYKVGDESCACPNMAKSLAEKSGEEMHFVVGQEETCCSTEARIKLAHARYRAALEALSKMESDSKASPEA